MKWTVLHEKNNRIVLTSVSNTDEIGGLLPTGSFLTVVASHTNKDDNRRFILRVEESEQIALFNPSPLLADLSLDIQEADRECKNRVVAYRIHDISDRSDGLVDYIKPQSIARLSTSEEINIALDALGNSGISVFPSTIYSSRSQKLYDAESKPIQIKLPQEIFWHQIQISGKTGSGKTVATKYLANHFTSNPIPTKSGSQYNGAVLAINVKDTDFLHLEKESSINHLPNQVKHQIMEEWDALSIAAHGNTNFQILYSAHEKLDSYVKQGVNPDLCLPITLRADELDPNSLLGVVENLTELAQQALPDIFRYWQEKKPTGSSYSSFLDHIDNCIENDYNFQTISLSNRESTTRLNPSTAMAMRSRLESASSYFENDAGSDLNVEDILVEGKTTVIDIGKSLDFGSIVLRYVLNKLIELKQVSDIPILIIIDEVHLFYSNNASKAALADLDNICRTGRSKQIGVIFSSQNINDIPSGLTSVINTKLMFKSDEFTKRINGILPEDIMSMNAGFCVSNIHGMPQLRSIKFPLSPNGVI